MNKSIILLSGGLDSVVSLAVAKNEYNIDLALTFDYGQKSLETEVKASKDICNFYNIKHKIIKLDWLKEITQTALVSDKEIPLTQKDDLNSEEFTQNSMKSVWVPNRNGAFLNIAAAFADSYNYTHIIIGANKEEGATFPDNTQEFIDRLNECFKYSTQTKPQVIAPLINFNKGDIVKKALEVSAPLNLVRSCYSYKNKHCGVCESCVRLKRALEENNCKEVIEALF